MKVSLFSLFTLLLTSTLFSQKLAEKQKDCSEFYRGSCFDVRESYKDDDTESEINDRDMILDTQSKSSLFSKGDTAYLKMRAYAGQEYRLTFCTEEIFGEEAIEYKIYERRRVLIDWKKYDDSVRTVQLEAYKLDSIKQDSIMNASESTYDYYDNYEDDDSYYDDFSNSDSYEDEVISSTKRQKFEVKKVMLYDNSSDEMAPTVSFPAKENMSLIIEMQIPGEAPKSNFKLNERGCVGVLIEHIQISDTGF